jgi:mRNA-degrading endonuclease RelE of RelBE toxin-antitoxin system
MRLLLSRTFKKNYEKLPQDTQQKIKEALRKICLNPQSSKKLFGDLAGELSFRIGRYRIIYFIDKDGDIWVETVRHRKDVYRIR